MTASGAKPSAAEAEVPGAGIEPTRLCGRPRILSPLRLPVSPPRHGTGARPMGAARQRPERPSCYGFFVAVNVPP
jgi:hypothetical protein